MNTNKSFSIRTFGCKVNQYESQAMREMLLSAGFVEALTRQTADIFVINTCTVTSQADKEARYFINLLHRKNPNAKIVLTGCLAEDAAGAMASLPGVVGVVKNADKNRIADFLKTMDDISAPAASRDLTLKITGFANHAKAFLKIQDGCENFCSYCKVPYVRGKFSSKPVENIKEEVETLYLNGFKEIILTGICLGAWSAGRGGLVEALIAIDSIPGDFRIRLSSIELKYVTDELMDFLAGNKRFCRHLHIPIQSGDDSILARMNRPYTVSDFLNTVNKARRTIPDIAITTDVMVGFPGETNSNFRNTVKAIRDIVPLRTHIFTFSRREGTAAYDMAPIISPDIASRRHAELSAVTLDTSLIFRMGFIGRNLDVLVETKRDKATGYLTGYTDNYIKVRFDAPDSKMKKIIPIAITNAEEYSTTGVYNY